MTTATPAKRLISLDQFRGYTVFGMLLVNFIGGYRSSPRLLRHTHDYCSYADTIMPQFLFAAGFAMQLSLGGRIARGEALPWRRILRRISGLALVAVGWYSITGYESLLSRWQSGGLTALLVFGAKRQWMQTLLHIAITSLWILPVVGRPAVARLLLAAGSVLTHAGLSWWFNFSWVNSDPGGIDGGPFGFLTWTLPATAGTFACDVVRSHSGSVRDGVIRLVGSGCMLMLLGWCLSLPTTLYNVPTEQRGDGSDQKLASDPVIPSSDRIANRDHRLVESPFVPPPPAAERQWNYWMMSQRCGAPSYLIFASGCCLLIFALFFAVCDGRSWQLGMFRTLGTNALAAYILHDIAGWIIGPLIPEAASFLQASLAFLPFLALVYGACRLLEWKGWLLRV